jgi:rRNA-processing protein FCF1
VACTLKLAAISFVNQHGIFLRKKERDDFKADLGNPLRVGTSACFGFEECRDFDEINWREEARTILTLYENLLCIHSNFFKRHRAGQSCSQTSDQFEVLLELYPEFIFRGDSVLSYIYRHVKTTVDAVLAYNSNLPQKLTPSLNKKITTLEDTLFKHLQKYYEDVDYAIGVGVHIGNYLASRPIELSFGIGELDRGNMGRIIHDRPSVANPFLLKWVFEDIALIKADELYWKPLEIDVNNAINLPLVKVKNLKLRCYVPSTEILPSVGLKLEEAKYGIRKSLLDSKPFVTISDFILPFTCPSMVLSVSGPKHEVKEVRCPTFYGEIPKEPIVIYRFNEVSDLDVEFFNFPIFNKSVPVILDTNAIDISRFHMASQGSFFQAYLENRLLIIPKVVLHEVKTRMRTADRDKVQKAMVRLNNLVSWGFLKGITVEGEFPDLGNIKKEDIEDLRDCMVLDTAIKRNGIIFTNDSDLVKLAMMMGVYPIGFSGLEEDVILTIKENNLQLEINQIIEKVGQLGTCERQEEYPKDDIHWMIEHLCQQGIVRKQRMVNKEVLEFLGYKRTMVI